MNVWAVVCAALVAQLATVEASAVQQGKDSCDLIKIFSIIKPLESNEDVKKCIASTGYELLPPPAAPTKEQVAKLCASDSCKAVFTSLQKMDIPDCSISILGGLNMKKVISEAFGQCSGTDAAKPTEKPSTPSVTPTVKPAPKPDSAATKPPAPAPAPGPATPQVPPVAPVKPQPPVPAPAPAPGPGQVPPGPAPAPVPAPIPAPTSAPGPAPGPVPATVNPKPTPAASTPSAGAGKLCPS
ncbi:hypothetical protein P43SY_003102 [Pythium insidiosum]|uniref:Elicitin-like protein n=1 Tax=Pythium insidiosum TaxID=114742 RepID=A0AAD5LP96_PYTIN|nr:hypothetical protein P43SY_003102 [Pythium insidiosum]